MSGSVSVKSYYQYNTTVAAGRDFKSEVNFTPM